MRQGVQDYLACATLHGLAKRHGLSRNLIRIWIQKFEAGDFDKEAVAADTIESYEVRIGALERLVGRQALESEFRKGARKHGPQSRNATTSVITGPVACPSQKRLMGIGRLTFYDSLAVSIDVTALVERMVATPTASRLRGLWLSSHACGAS